MSTFDKVKDKPVWAAISVGTALGTCAAIIDTAAWNTIQIHSKHGGTGGSRDVSVYCNIGTVPGTSVTAMPDLLFIGSINSDFAGAGNPIARIGSLTHQTIITYGTSTDLSFSLSYQLGD